MIDIKRIRRWRWAIGARCWQVRRDLLNWIFNHLYSVRCRFVRDQRPNDPPEADAVVRALGGGRYIRYSLRRGHRILATLIEYDSDFPWIFCHCTGSPAFEEVRPYFEEFSEVAQAIGSPEGDKAWRRALRRGRRLGLTLVPLEMPKSQGPFPILLYVDGEKARFRMSSSPNATSWPW